MGATLKYLWKWKMAYIDHCIYCLRNHWRKVNYPSHGKRLMWHQLKKGSRSLPTNYCPVSLASIVCKMLESIIKDRIMAHFAKNNLFSKCQHGFWPEHSCVTQLLIKCDRRLDCNYGIWWVSWCDILRLQESIWSSTS